VTHTIPTQGGDCKNKPSRIIPGIIGGMGIYTEYLVQPRFYYPVGATSCTGNGALAPYNFSFRVRLGNESDADLPLPKQIMILNMKTELLSGHEPIFKAASELPVAFPYTSLMRYAYYSADGSNYSRLQRCDTSVGCTHDTSKWPNYRNTNIDGRVIMLSSTPDAVENPSAGVGMAFYSHVNTGMIISRRSLPNGTNLTLIAMVGDVISSTRTLDGPDGTVFSLTRLMAVGNLSTIKAALGNAQQRISDWGNWYNQ
jgi:hypothetical protein